MPSSYFDKLKRGMNIGEEIEEEKEIKEEAEKELKEVENIERVPKEKAKKKELPEFKKIEIEVSPVRNNVSNGVKPAGSEEKEKIKEKIPEEKPSTRAELGAGPVPHRNEVSGAGKEKWFGQEGQLTVDVYKTSEFLVIQSAVAGVKPEDLDISIENDLVIIRGSREKTAEAEKRDYFYQECYWGPFSRKIILPEEVDPSRTEATMKEGILTIKIPRIERQKKRKILIKE